MSEDSFESVAEVVARIQRDAPKRASADPRPSSHAARQRRYRLRQRNGQITVTLTLSETEVDRLHRQRCLDLDKLEDRRAIADAIHLLIGSIIGGP